MDDNTILATEVMRRWNQFIDKLEDMLSKNPQLEDMLSKTPNEDTRYARARSHDEITRAFDTLLDDERRGRVTSTEVSETLKTCADFIPRLLIIDAKELLAFVKPRFLN